MSGLDLRNYPFNDDDIPGGWALTSLGPLCASIHSGYACGAHTKDGKGIPHLRPMNVSSGGVIDLSDLRFVPEPAQKTLNNGDVLFNNTNSTTWVGKTAVVDTDKRMAFSNHMTRLVPRPFLCSYFLALQLHALQRSGYFGQRCKKHVNQSSISSDFLSESLPFLLPPLNEQKRIVKKIDHLQTRSKRGREALEAILPLIEKFRQSVLASAFRGDLTKEWREKNRDKIEPASELLKRIRVERRKKWEEERLNKFETSGTMPVGDKWKEKYIEPAPIETEGLPELPEGWEWAPLGLLGLDPFCAVQTGPFGAQLHNKEFVEAGVPVIAVGNLTGLGFTRRGLYYITTQKALQLSRYDVSHGDILFARSGATLGKVCVAPEYIKDWRMTGHILRARLNPKVIYPYLAVSALWGAPAVKAQVNGGIRGMTRPGYNTSLLESIMLPLPPYQEQHILTRRIESALQRVEEYKTLVKELTNRTTTLDQSILAKAFRGELVPQDPDDEPASLLLERIKAEREKELEVKGHKRKGSKRDKGIEISVEKAEKAENIRGRKKSSKGTELEL